MNESVDSADALERLIAAVEFEVPPIRDGVDVERRLGILLNCAKDARASMTPTTPLGSEVFFHTDFGNLGKVYIILPKNNGGKEQFEADFEETLDYVRRIMIRRKRANPLSLEVFEKQED